MYFSVFQMSDAKEKKEGGIKSRRDGELKSKSACHGERGAKQTFEKESCEINEQRKCHPCNKRGCNHADSLISSSHLIRELTIITQLTTGDPITST